MSPTLGLLEAFYKDKLGVMLQHEAGARFVGQYDINNTYQYIVNREEVQLSWVAKAIEELGGTVAPQTPATRVASGKPRAAEQHVIAEDLKASQAFLDQWGPRVDAMTNARHQGMLRIILGETLEQIRFFEQALAGRTDLLGRRGEQLAPSHGEVMPARWVE